VSGAAFVLPPACSSQAFACTAGIAAFCACSPEEGANSAPRLVAYFWSAAERAISPPQTRSTVATTSCGTPLGMKMPK
jgi:hypothetical protein